MWKASCSVELSRSIAWCGCSRNDGINGLTHKIRLIFHNNFTYPIWMVCVLLQTAPNRWLAYFTCTLSLHIMNTKWAFDSDFLYVYFDCEDAVILLICPMCVQQYAKSRAFHTRRCLRPIRRIRIRCASNARHTIARCPMHKHFANFLVHSLSQVPISSVCGCLEREALSHPNS